MRQFQEKQKIKAKIYSKPMLIALCVVALLFAKAVTNIFMKYRESVSAKQIAVAKLASLHEREESLKADIANLQSKEGVEEELRKKFNVANPGEKMIVVVENEPEAPKEPERGFFGSIGHTIASWFK